MSQIDPAMRRLRDEAWLPKIAETLKIARQAPYAWRQVPHQRVLDVARLTKMKPHELRPDLYPPPRKRKRNGR